MAYAPGPQGDDKPGCRSVLLRAAALAACGSWGTITSVAILDGATLNAGNLLFYDNTLADQAVTTGDTVSFAAGALDIVMT